MSRPRAIVVRHVLLPDEKKMIQKYLRRSRAGYTLRQGLERQGREGLYYMAKDWLAENGNYP